MSTSNLDSGWYYSKREDPNRRQIGPMGWPELVALGRSGELGAADMVWHPSLTGWLPATQVGGLLPPGQPVVPKPPQGVLASQPPYGPLEAGNVSWAPPRAGRRISHLAWIIPLVTLVVVGVAFGLYFGLRDGDAGRGSSGTVTTGSSGSTAVSSTGSTGTSTVSTVAPGESGTWLVMMYEAAEDEILEEDMLFDLNEAELVGSTEQVRIVTQFDRYAGGYDGDGDVTSTKRYLLTRDGDLTTLNSEELADLGEVDMGDGESLYDFATWAIGSYPSEHYVLILSDHGGGWTGGWSDDDPEEGSWLSIHEIDEVLGQVVVDTGIGGFELVGFDACLMGQLEVMSAVAPHAKYAVGSAETEPSLGWGYAGFLQALVDDPAMTGRELGQAIVESYISQDVRITDDESRGLLTGGDYTAEEVIAELQLDTTLATVDLTAMDDLNEAINTLALALLDADQQAIAQARAYAQSYESVFSEDDPPSFIDLGHFVELLIEDAGDPLVAQAAEQVKTALAEAVTSEAHGENRPGSSGLSIYFPNSSEYEYTFGGWDIDYPSSVGRFAAASLWDDFLTFHYTGEPFEPGFANVAFLYPEQSTETDFSYAAEEAVPEEGAEIVAPGAGELSIAPISVSSDEIGLDGIVYLSSEITGSNIAYVYYYVSYYWEEDGSYLTADMGFVEPGYTKEIGGVYYPDWGDDDVVTVEYAWEPTLFYMSDGDEANDQFAFFEPTVYGAETSGDVYTVRGTYTFVDTGTEIDAEMDFNGDGDMLGVWGYSGGSDDWGAGTWHEIIPEPGDMFTITEEYLEFDEDPEGSFVDYYGGTMTFGDTPFTMVAYYAFPGSYVLAIGVEDLDGNISWEFVEVTVTE